MPVDPPNPLEPTLPRGPAVLTNITPPLGQIAFQSSARGRSVSLARVATGDGALLLPYGDYDLNTGPVSVLSYRPGDGFVSTLYGNLRDERIQQYRTLNGGRIWTCTTDPMGREEATLARSAAGGVGPWSAVTASVPGKGPAVHLFDIIQLSNGDLFVCGARNYTAAEHAARPGASPDDEQNGALFVWRSTNGGTTWSEDFVAYKDGDGLYRPYGFGRTGDTIVLPDSDGAHWLRAPDGTWTARRTTPAMRVYSPPAWDTDGVTFATADNPGYVYMVVDGMLRASTPRPGFDRALAHGPRGWLTLDNGIIIRYGTTTYGTVPRSVTNLWSGCVIGDVVYLSDGERIYRCDPTP